MTPDQSLVDLAISAANASPCAKSKRGVVIAIQGVPVGRSLNGPPGDLDCASRDHVGPIRLAGGDLRAAIGDAAAACRMTCADRCVHAEVRAIRSALVHVSRAITLAAQHLVAPPKPHEFGTWVRMAMRKAVAIHVKTIDGRLVPGGGPSCADCAREVRDTIGGVWLFEADRQKPAPPVWRCYSSDDFHRASLAAAGLPPFEQPLFTEAEYRADARPLLAMDPDDWRIW